MSKVSRVPSDTWQKKVYVGTNEDGEKMYDTVYGDSKEEVEKKSGEISKKNQYNRQNEWQKKNADRVSVVLPKGTKERIAALGESVNKFVNDAVLKELFLREASGNSEGDIPTLEDMKDN